MGNKSRLVLIEHMIMLLVFALAASMCVRIFVRADRLSKEYEATDRAAVVTQNAAEALKKNGIFDFVAETEAVSVGESRWEIYYDSEWEITEEKEKKYSLHIGYTEDASGYLWRAELSVLTESGEEVFRLPVAGQIVAEVTEYEEV